jgi:acetyl-CoA carboxylase biotin carboxyl carrier protein
MPEPVNAPVAGSVWRVLVGPGQSVEADEEIVTLESMKMEIPVEVSRPGTITRVIVDVGQAVAEGDLIAELE